MKEQLLTFDHEINGLIDNDSDSPYRLIFEKSLDNIFIIEVCNKQRFLIKRVNPALAAVLISKPEQLTGKYYDEILNESQLKSVEPYYNRCIISKEICQYEEVAELPDRKIYYLTQLIPVLNAQHEVCQIIGVSRDITDRKNAEMQLQNYADDLVNSNANKDKFVQILAHDLKNPFNALIGFTDLLLNNLRKYDIDIIEKQLRVIYHTASQTNLLLDDLLLWSMSQSGKLPYEPCGARIGEIVAAISDSISANALAKNINMAYEIDENLLVFADNNMIKTVLRNLLTNAIKFTQISGKVILRIEKMGTFCLCIVADNGIGIGQEEFKNIWQLGTSSRLGTLGERGTGLGLVICKEFVERNGGKIWVESKSGSGSTFMFTVPLLG